MHYANISCLSSEFSTRNWIQRNMPWKMLVRIQHSNTMRVEKRYEKTFLLCSAVTRSRKITRSSFVRRAESRKNPAKQRSSKWRRLPGKHARSAVCSYIRPVVSVYEPAHIRLSALRVFAFDALTASVGKVRGENAGETETTRDFLHTFHITSLILRPSLPGYLTLLCLALLCLPSSFFSFPSTSHSPLACRYHPLAHSFASGLSSLIFLPSILASFFFPFYSPLLPSILAIKTKTRGRLHHLSNRGIRKATRSIRVRELKRDAANRDISTRVRCIFLSLSLSNILYSI